MDWQIVRSDRIPQAPSCVTLAVCLPASLSVKSAEAADANANWPRALFVGRIQGARRKVSRNLHLACALSVMVS